VTACLPEHINTFEYTRNHHFVRLGRKDGSEVKLLAGSKMLYACPNKCMEFLTESNHGVLKCPLCGDTMTSAWGREQVCFIPEKESDFEFFKK
jgi:uncharacterized Zn finger protein (UPF0148 family)